MRKCWTRILAQILFLLPTHFLLINSYQTVKIASKIMFSHQKIVFNELKFAKTFKNRRDFSLKKFNFGEFENFLTYQRKWYNLSNRKCFSFDIFGASSSSFNPFQTLKISLTSRELCSISWIFDPWIISLVPVIAVKIGNPRTRSGPGSIRS